MPRFYSPKGLSRYQKENGVVISGLYGFINGIRFELNTQYKSYGPWEADFNAFRHLTPENLIKWSEE